VRPSEKALGHLGDVPVLPTAAGHDAGILSTRVPTAMLFVRNPTGVSRSPEEHAEMAGCNQGAAALADIMADWISEWRPRPPGGVSTPGSAETPRVCSDHGPPLFMPRT
jgi:hypothetical protein